MATLKDSQTTQNDYWYLGNGSVRLYASSFTAGSSYTLIEAQWYCKKSGSPTFNIRGYIYSDSSGSPGTLLATSTNDVAASGITTSYGWQIVHTFSGQALTSGTKYHLVVHALTDGDGSNLIVMGCNGSVTGQALRRSYDTSPPSWVDLDTSAQNDFRTYEADATTPAGLIISGKTLRSLTQGRVLI
jgi:hypothetical protein